MAEHTSPLLDSALFEQLFAQAALTPRLRQHYDLRESETDTSQRMLNALLPGTPLPIHRHLQSSETILVLKGSMDEIFYDDNGNETARFHLEPGTGVFGMNIPRNTWHTVMPLEPTIIIEAKDGAYNIMGTENLAIER